MLFFNHANMHSSKSVDWHLWFGLVIFVIGAVILLQRFDLIPETTWGYLWPIILIVSGLKFMISYGASSECCDSGKCSDMDKCCSEPMMMKAVPKKKMARKGKGSKKK